jgi:hypothetical protein
MKSEVNYELYPYKLLTKYFLKNNYITAETMYSVEEVPARILINANRIDIMAKWIYIDALERGINTDWAKEVYIKHIEAFSEGSFIEPGTEEKNSIDAYLQIFRELIKDIKKRGFDENISLIPVGAGDILLDGSHRTSIAAYYNYNIKIIRFEGLTRDYGTDFFKRRLLYETYLDELVFQYTFLKENIYAACVWPVANEALKKDIAVKEIESIGKIVYKREFDLGYKGLRNFMVQIYGHQTWTGTIYDKHSGVMSKVDACYKKKKKVFVIFFECDNFEIVLQVKRKIRDLFGMENHSIHISDNYLETRYISQLLLNPNSFHHLCFGNPDKHVCINEKLEEFKSNLYRHCFNLQDFVIVSDSVLAIYGLRDAENLEFLSSTGYCRMNPVQKNTAYQKHVMDLYGCTIEDMLYNSRNYFIYNGIKFASLKRIRYMKKNRGLKADRLDIGIIFFTLLSEIRFNFIQKYHLIRCRYFCYKRKYAWPFCIFKLLCENIMK